MTREKLIAKTIDRISRLPDQKLKEVSDFADFLLSKIEDGEITEGIQKMAAESESFHFLEEEEELYKASDLKEKYR